MTTTPVLPYTKYLHDDDLPANSRIAADECPHVIISGIQVILALLWTRCYTSTFTYPTLLLCRVPINPILGFSFFEPTKK